MAILYRITNGTATRWGTTEADAGAALPGGGDVERVAIDEIEMRQAACAWLNFRAKTAENAKKREAKKTASEKTATAAKVWAKRRANGTDKWK